MSDRVIQLDHVWKEYPLRRDTKSFKEYAVHFHQRLGKDPQKKNKFYALKDISLRVEKEECIGIIGRNGAGKSTLLSLILGTTPPSKGSVWVKERVTPLLELGAGFHPDLSGWENIILNGVLLGLTKSELMGKIPSIVLFSGLNDFIHVPVRTYSSGMYLRLAFSVAIHTDPRIFIIDEVLSVGDEEFQKKSKEALLTLIRGGVTTVLVSHNLPTIEDMCTRVLWLEEGTLLFDGSPQRAVESYRKKMTQTE